MRLRQLVVAGRALRRSCSATCNGAAHGRQFKSGAVACTLCVAVHHVRLQQHHGRSPPAPPQPPRGPRAQLHPAMLHRRAAAALLLAAVAAAAWGGASAASAAIEGEDVPGIAPGTTVPGLKSKTEVEMANQMLRAMTMVAQEINTGVESDDALAGAAAAGPMVRPPFPSLYAWGCVTGMRSGNGERRCPGGRRGSRRAPWCVHRKFSHHPHTTLTHPSTLNQHRQFLDDEVDAAGIQAKVMGAALARWQMGVASAPSNKGLKPSKFRFYDRDHYYQVRLRSALLESGWLRCGPLLACPPAHTTFDVLSCTASSRCSTGPQELHWHGECGQCGAAARRISSPPLPARLPRPSRPAAARHAVQRAHLPATPPERYR